MQCFLQNQNHMCGNLMQENKQNFASLQTLITQKHLHPISFLPSTELLINVTLIEWFVLEGTLKDHPVPTPLP